ncbi:hypothetical protein GGI42DRAFT_213439 [Trichoderma sp. SZMC 28013]
MPNCTRSAKWMVDATLQKWTQLQSTWGQSLLFQSLLSCRQARRLQLVVQLAAASACAAAQRRRLAAQTHEVFFFLLFCVPVLALSGRCDPCWAPGGAVGLLFGSKRKMQKLHRKSCLAAVNGREPRSLLPLAMRTPSQLPNTRPATRRHNSKLE